MFEKIFEFFSICIKHKKIHSSCCEIDINDPPTPILK